jgi:arylsulfatase
VSDRKLVRDGLRGSWELFDLKLDRTEQHNLAEDQAVEVERLRKQWQAWAHHVRAMPKPPTKKKAKN